MPVTEGKVSVTEGAGKNLATATVTTGAGVVEREETVLADPETVAARLKITNADPGGSDYGLVARIAGTVPLPTGAATAANQTLQATAANQATEITSLATIASAVRAEDTMSADADKGIAPLAVRQDVPVADTSTTGDYGWIKTDAQGRLWVNSDVLTATLAREATTRMALAVAMAQLRLAANQPQNGFTPMEVPAFYGG